MYVSHFNSSLNWLKDFTYLTHFNKLNNIFIIINILFTYIEVIFLLLKISLRSKKT